jgi:hypothetical protein
VIDEEKRHHLARERASSGIRWELPGTGPRVADLAPAPALPTRAISRTAEGSR